MTAGRAMKPRCCVQMKHSYFLASIFVMTSATSFRLCRHFDKLQQDYHLTLETNAWTAKTAWTARGCDESLYVRKVSR